MRRVEAHRLRRPVGWHTLEVAGEDLRLIADRAADKSTVLLDSLTLWVSGRMHADESTVLNEFENFLSRTAPLETPFVLVSDEVGLGVVPESASGRKFRDLLGLVNQQAAVSAQEVHLCVAGIPLRVK